MNAKAVAFGVVVIALVYLQYTRYKGDVSFGALEMLPNTPPLAPPGDPEAAKSLTGFTADEEWEALNRYRRPVGTVPTIPPIMYQF